jgi:PST family polysaccharide transporter
MLRFSARVSEGLMGAVLRMYVKHVPAVVAVALASWAVAAAVRPVGSDVLTLVAAAAAGGVAALGVLVLLRGRFAEELAVVANLRRRKKVPVRA